MITGINESKALSCEDKCKFDGRNVIQVNGGITMNTDVSVKKIIYVEKTMFEILLHVIVKMGNISKYYG